jgi:hypothetical protein
MHSIIEYELQSLYNYLPLVLQELISSKFFTLKFDKGLNLREIVAKRNIAVFPSLISKYGSYTMLIIANFLFGLSFTKKGNNNENKYA